MGEHLPCKQGVKSSNLSISTRQFLGTVLYLENFIQKIQISNDCMINTIMPIETSEEVILIGNNQVNNR